VGDVQHDHLTDLQWQESFVHHHPIRAATDEAAHPREIAGKGDSVATPAILAGVVVAFVVPFAAVLIMPDFGAGRFA